jgi:pimeloyl-ACP methyl ester carboxylesterase
MVAAIRDADLVVIEGAAHIANLARPAEFRSAVRGHLAASGS